jgi:DNA-binding MarR family transcriptional regulator
MSEAPRNTMSAVTKLSPAKALRLYEGLTRAHAAVVAALEKDMLPEAGIPLAWYDVLADLCEAPGGVMRLQELARVTGITDSGASRRLDQMMKAGLIERQSCPTDRRGVFAHITEKGRAAFVRARAVFTKSLNRHLAAQLEPEDAKAMTAALSRLG